MKPIPFTLALAYSAWGLAFPPLDVLHAQSDQLILTPSKSKTEGFGAPVLAPQSDVVELNEEKTIYEVLQSYPGSVLAGRNGLGYG